MVDRNGCARVRGARTFARKRIAEWLGEVARNRENEIREKQARLARTESRIANLVDVLASGERSPSISNALRDMEAHAGTERQGIEALDRLASQPIHLPTPDEVMERVRNLDDRLTQDPIAGREELKRYIEDGKIELRVREDGVYVARWKLQPEILLLD